MIIDFNKEKEHRVKPAATSDIRRLEREIARIEQKIESDGQDKETLVWLQSAKNRHQLVLILRQQLIPWKKKLEQKRAEMLEDALLIRCVTILISQRKLP